MTTTDEDKNAAIIAALREEFLPVVERLTGEIEPAVVYTPVLEESASKE